MLAKLCFLGRAMPSLAPSLSAEAGGSCKQAEDTIEAGGRSLAHKEGHRWDNYPLPWSRRSDRRWSCRGSPLLTRSPLGPAHGQLVPATWGYIVISKLASEPQNTKLTSL